jgi:acyl carrier protein
MKIEDKILSIIRSNTEEKASISLGSDLRKDLRLDSFGTLMVINAIEEAFGITVDDADFARVNTVGDVVALLRTQYACAGGAYATV